MNLIDSLKEQIKRDYKLIILILAVLFLLAATTQAYNLTFNECVEIVNMTNETNVICAPGYPTLNQTIELGYSDIYRNDALNLTVVSQQLNPCPDCNLTCPNTLNASCPPLREIEWLIGYNQTRVAENVSKITITGPPLPQYQICETCNYSNCSANSTIYVNNCTNTTVNQTVCPQLKYGTFYLQPGESLNMSYFESIRTTCMSCPEQQACPDCIVQNLSCPACKECEVCPSDIVNFQVDGNCTVQTFDQLGNKLCLDSRDKYCMFACQEVRQQLVAMNSSYQAAMANLNGNKTALDAEKRNGENMNGVATMGTFALVFLTCIVLIARNYLPKGGVKNGQH